MSGLKRVKGIKPNMCLQLNASKYCSCSLRGKKHYVCGVGHFKLFTYKFT